MGVLRKWTQSCLAVVLRRNLTLTLHQRYLKKNNLYDVSMMVAHSKSLPTYKDGRRCGSPVSIVTDEANSDDEDISEHVRLLPSSNRRMKHSASKHESLDNPDQTIAQDIDKFSQELSNLLVEIVTIPILIAYYTFQVYDITQAAIAPVLIYIFFLASWVLCVLAMNAVVPAVYAKEQREGDFRFNHVHSRTEAEAIAMMHCESSEKQRLDTLLKILVNASYVVLEKTLPLNYCVTLTGFLGALISYLAISIPVFDGTFDGKTEAEITGIVSKNLFVCLYLIHQFHTLTKLSGNVSELSGYTTRIAMLLESCDRLEHESLQENASKSIETLNHVTNNSRRQHSSSSTPAPLLEVNLHSATFSVLQGQHTLIQGPSGCGKSTLFRVLSNIWPISLPNDIFQFNPTLLPPFNTETSSPEFHPSKIMFLPQQGLIIPISPPPSGVLSTQTSLTPLLTQLTYPLHPSESTITDAQAEDLLSRVGLSHIVTRCHQESWHPTESNDGFVAGLSGGEKQRLQIARVLFWKPRIVFLDESLGALDSEMELRLYKELLMGKEGSRDDGITVVTISHSDSEVVKGLFKQCVVIGGFVSHMTNYK
ncbi:UNVERIFIED_CONTAM: hypothetical protein HDU68_009902 [Siphonaria sp. JEL0065]|nr:hypothetical protein HDU68_009902 [Siphonaria sp. JEL0065]